MCTDADENSDSSLILKKKKYTHTHTVDPMWPWLSSLNALLFSKISVLSPARTWSCLCLGLTLLRAPCQSSDLCLLLFPLLFLLLLHRPFWDFQLHVLGLLCCVTTFPLTPVLASVSSTWSAVCLDHPPPPPTPLEGIPPYGGEGKKVKENVANIG